MKGFVHSVCVPESAIAADGTQVYELPVNPISHLLLVARPLNDTGTLSNFVSYLSALAAFLRVSVMLDGVSILQASGRDLAALAYFRRGCVFPQAYHGQTNNDRRAIVLPLFFGRRPFDPDECIPATRRGSLTLEVDFDIAATGYDGMRFSVESCELLGASPKAHERFVTRSLTNPATGEQALDLDTMSAVRGILLFGTTGMSGASPAPSWGRVGVFVDSMQVGYTSTDWEVAHGLHSLLGRQPPSYDAHKHIVTTDGNAQTELSTLAGPIQVGSGGFENFAFLDFDPLRNDAYSIDGSESSRVQLRVNAETADAVRYGAVERVKH